MKKKFSNNILVKWRFHLKPKVHAKLKVRDEYFIYVRFIIFQDFLQKHETTVSTGISCEKIPWDGRRIFDTSPENQQKNLVLDQINITIDNAMTELAKLNVGDLFTIKDEIENSIKPSLTDKAPRGKKAVFLSRIADNDLTTIRDKYLTGRKCTERYKKTFTDVLNCMKCFFDSSNTKFPTVKEITEQHLWEFRKWLEFSNRFTHNSIMTYLNRLRTLLKYADDKQIINRSPVPRTGFVKGYKKNKNKVVLTEDEMKLIYSFPEKEMSVSMVRIKYIFLFMAATGMGYSELKTVKLSHIDMINGQRFLQKNRNKTDEHFEFAFSKMAENIYSGYFNWIAQQKNFSEPFVNLPSIEYVTRQLKDLMELIGIKKNVTTYTARSTFSTNWVKVGGNIFVLQKILGHTDIRTTQFYLQIQKSDFIKLSNETYDKSEFHNMGSI